MQTSLLRTSSLGAHGGVGGAALHGAGLGAHGGGGGAALYGAGLDAHGGGGAAALHAGEKRCDRRGPTELEGPRLYM